MSDPQRFVHKPNSIEALRWTGNYDQMATWLGDALESATRKGWSHDLTIRNKDRCGVVARLSDWVIKHPDGSAWVYGPSEFEKNYELAPEAP